MRKSAYAGLISLASPSMALPQYCRKSIAARKKRCRWFAATQPHGCRNI
jgi:hypothetical protein